MANPFGRGVIIPLTNQSGGSVAAGDVVTVDTAHNDSFTTSTAGAVTNTGVGVAQQTIANGAIGLVAITGYVSLVNVNASVTRGNYGKTFTVAKQAVDAGASRVAGTFCQFLTGGTTPDAYIYQPDLGGASLTNPMTTSQDIIVGGASGAPGRLAVGGAGGHASVINSLVAYDSGTSFPTAVQHDRYWRRDLDEAGYYDGTRWLSVTQYTINLAPAFSTALSATGAFGLGGVFGGQDFWMEKAYCSAAVGATNDATHYWQFEIFKAVTGGGADATLFTAVDTKLFTASQKGNVTATIGALLGTNATYLYGFATKVSTASNLTNPTAVLIGRKVLT